MRMPSGECGTEAVDGVSRPYCGGPDRRAWKVVDGITTRAQAEARQVAVRKKLIGLLGGLPEKTPLNARSLGVTQAKGFRIERIMFDLRRGFP